MAASTDRLGPGAAAIQPNSDHQTKIRASPPGSRPTARAASAALVPIGYEAASRCAASRAAPRLACVAASSSTNRSAPRSRFLSSAARVRLCVGEPRNCFDDDPDRSCQDAVGRAEVAFDRHRDLSAPTPRFVDALAKPSQQRDRGAIEEATTGGVQTYGRLEADGGSMRGERHQGQREDASLFDAADA